MKICLPISLPSWLTELAEFRIVRAHSSTHLWAFLESQLRFQIFPFLWVARVANHQSRQRAVLGIALISNARGLWSVPHSKWRISVSLNDLAVMSLQILSDLGHFLLLLDLLALYLGFSGNFPRKQSASHFPENFSDGLYDFFLSLMFVLRSFSSSDPIPSLWPLTNPPSYMLSLVVRSPSPLNSPLSKPPL